MVKRWIVMLVLGIILVVSCVFETKYVNDSFKWLINSLETLQITINENKDNIDSEKIINDAYNIHEMWHEKVDLLKCLIWHTGIKDVEVGLARIAIYIEENDKTEAYVEIAALIDYCAHYIDDIKISTENIC